ncbi:universal stress protein [Psychroserpens sp.]|uniref:universal stress protein n=1 Tax=Psychroserpens sp. TaxID=2020870 RepID=UPI002B275988|nr:universal stress protein [Psychroserpens sp.]
MKKNKYKILVLSDMKSASGNTIKSGVSFAKMINADLHVFHVKKPTEIVAIESQLSAIRTINKSYLERDNAIKTLIEPISKDYDINITCNHAFGNVKTEIMDCIQELKPDIIVLGKRKSKSTNLLGDNITDFVIKNHEGAVIIASEENALMPNTELSLGVLNGDNNSFNLEFAHSLFNHTQKPLRSFTTDLSKVDSKDSKASINKNTVEVVFDNGANSIKSLSNYLTKSDVNLLCVNRGHKSKANNKSDFKNVISKVNVSLLISCN